MSEFSSSARSPSPRCRRSRITRGDGDFNSGLRNGSIGLRRVVLSSFPDLMLLCIAPTSKPKQDYHLSTTRRSRDTMLAMNQANLVRGARGLRAALITPTAPSVRLASTSAATAKSGASSSSSKGVTAAMAAGIAVGAFVLSSLSRPALQLEERRRWDQRLVPKPKPASQEAPKAEAVASSGKDTFLFLSLPSNLAD